MFIEADVALIKDMLGIPRDVVKLLGNRLVASELFDAVEFLSRTLA